MSGNSADSLLMEHLTDDLYIFTISRKFMFNDKTMVIF